MNVFTDAKYAPYDEIGVYSCLVFGVRVATGGDATAAVFLTDGTSSDLYVYLLSIYGHSRLSTSNAKVPSSQILCPAALLFSIGHRSCSRFIQLCMLLRYYTQR